MASETPDATAPKRTVDVIVENNRSAGATLYLAVFAANNEQANWQQERLQAHKMVLPREKESAIQIKLADGYYALRAYADINNNSELDTQRFNRPLEPFAISVAPGRDKPSMRFHNAVVSISEGSRSVRLKLIYPEDLVDGTGEASAGGD